jgi:hypothetical protein
MPLTTVDQGLLSTNAQYTGFKNRIINGDMTIDQRNAGAAVTVNGAAPYTLDRWFAEDVTDGVFTVQRVADAPAGFSFSARVTITTADASLAAGQYAVFVQRIEGFNFADLAFGTADASPITLSFRVKSSLTGTFGGVVSNSSENYSYPFTYTISAANTWETKSVTIPGATAGTWTGATNANAFVLGFSLGSGSTYTGTPGAWAAADARGGATGQTNIIGTLNATWQVTGVQIERGQTATSFDVLPYTTELALCQRYFCKTYNPDVVPGAGSSAGYPGSLRTAIQTTNNYTGLGPWSFPVAMRATPTMVIYNPQNGAVGGFVGDGTNYSPAVAFNPGTSGCSFYTNNVTVGTATFIAIAATASAEL